MDVNGYRQLFGYKLWGHGQSKGRRHHGQFKVPLATKKKKKKKKNDPLQN